MAAVRLVTDHRYCKRGGVCYHCNKPIQSVPFVSHFNSGNGIGRTHHYHLSCSEEVGLEYELRDSKKLQAELAKSNSFLLWCKSS